jgi:hypothetical protein
MVCLRHPKQHQHHTLYLLVFTMLVWLLLLGVLAYYSQRYCPTQEQFRAHLRALGKDRLPNGTPEPSQTTSGTSTAVRLASQATARVGRFFERIATVATPAPSIKYASYQMFAIATVHYVTGDEATYLGWLGTWWLISEVRIEGPRAGGASSGSASDEQTDALEQAESLRDAAISAKRNGMHMQAAQTYEKAGDAFWRIAQVSEHSEKALTAHEAGNCYEDAYRCYKQAASTSNTGKWSLLKAGSEQVVVQSRTLPRCVATATSWPTLH